MQKSEEIKTEILRRRTFAIISHPDAGKTTLTEKLLYHGGVLREAGEVRGKAGTKAATSDWMQLEKEKGISVTSSVMQFDYAGLRVNLLDTPGHKDFSEDTYRVLTAVDSAVMLIDVAKGVEERTRKLYDVCRYRNIPIFTFVNKLDREGKSPLELIDEIESTLGMRCYPITWPVGIGDRFQGIYHRGRKELILYDQKRAGDEVSVVPLNGEVTEEILSQYINDSYVLEQTIEELALVEGVLPPFEPDKFHSGELSPVMFGSAKQNFAVDVFLDFFAQYAPQPAPRATKSGELVDPTSLHMSGFVFKIQANMDRKHRDRVAFIRICSGAFERGMRVNHFRLNREIRLSHSSQFMAQDRELVEEAYAGDILGVNDSGNFQIGDSVCSQGKVEFEDIPRFAPELFAKLRVPDAMKRQKLQKGLKELAEEGAIQLFIDPLVGHQDPVVGVVGELQFLVLQHRMEDEYNLDVRLDRQPFSVARWPQDKQGDPVEELNGNFQIFRDLNDAPVILLAQEWDLNWAQRENPDVEFKTSIRKTR